MNKAIIITYLMVNKDEYNNIVSGDEREAVVIPTNISFYPGLFNVFIVCS